MTDEIKPKVHLVKIKSHQNESLPAFKQEKLASSDLVSEKFTPDINDHKFEIEADTTNEITQEQLLSSHLTQEQCINNNDADKSQIPFSIATKQRKFNLLSDYSAYSSIHGVRYFSDSQRHWSERRVILTKVSIYLKVWHIDPRFDFNTVR